MDFYPLMADVALWTIVGIDTRWFGDPAVLKPIVGWILVVGGLIGIYLSGAVVCNPLYGKTIFFVPPPLIK
jgi:uncharacterized protein